jgi:hypothetical protein
MSLSDLAAIGSFISGFAVLVSLVFLYFQLRQVNAQVQQAEKNRRALMNQGVVTRSADAIRWNGQPENIALHARITAGETDFSAQEVRQIGGILRLLLDSGQDVYVQHKAGLADQITFDNILKVLTAALSQPVVRAAYFVVRTTCAPEWMSYVDKLMEQTPLAKPVDIVGRFKGHLAEVMG